MQLLGLLASVIPLTWAGLLVREMRLAHRLETVGIETMGRVLRQRKSDGRGGRQRIPTIGFTTQLGEPVEGESAGNTASLDFFDGDEVLLYYDPAQPARFLLAEELPNTHRYVWLVLASLLLIVYLFVWAG